MTATRTTRRDALRPGDVFASSHGYRVLVTEVHDDAFLRTDDRHVGIVGHLHADPKAPTVTERYPAGSTVEVEIRTRTVLVHLNVEMPEESIPADITSDVDLADTIAAEVLGALEVGTDPTHTPFLTDATVEVAMAEEV